MVGVLMGIFRGGGGGGGGGGGLSKENGKGRFKERKYGFNYGTRRF